MINKGISRRRFIRDVAASALGVTAAGVLGGCAPEVKTPADQGKQEVPAASASRYSWDIPPEPITNFDKVIDLSGQFLVIGAGMSGYAVAARLVDEKQKVTMIAKTDTWTGIGGSVYAFNSSLAKSLGGEVNVEEALGRVFEMMSHNVDEDLWRVFATRSGEAMDWACDISTKNGLIPIISEVEHGPLGEYVGTHNFAGGSNCSFYTSKVDGAGEPQVTTIGSPIKDFLPIMEKHCTERGATINYGITAKQFLKDDKGRVIGAACVNADGQSLAYTNARAVVLCSGDYSMDEEMLKAYCPMADSPNLMKGFLPYTTGDGQKMALWAGAALQKTKPHAPMIFSLPIECTMGQSPSALSTKEIRALYEGDPQLLQRYQTAKESIVCLTMSKNNLLVNLNGERYNNEHTVMGYEGIQLLHQPEGKAFNIYTKNWMSYIPEQSGYLGGPVATKEDYTMFMCPGDGFATIEELADFHKLPADTLKKTIERYNEMCKNGKDTDYFKPAEHLCTIDMNGPFYCIPTYNALLVCIGGVDTDTDMHVLDTSGEIMPGLYANGTIAGNFCGNNYTTVFPGLNFGRSLCFGYLLGEYLTKNE